MPHRISVAPPDVGTDGLSLGRGVAVSDSMLIVTWNANAELDVIVDARQTVGQASMR